jgi:hypothetical protein
MSGREDTSRDHPLTCHWRPVDPDAYEVLGLPPARSRAEAIARANIITEAFVVGRADPEAWISYSRQKAWYAGRSRYWPAAFTYVTVVRTVDTLAAGGLLDHQQMPPLHFGWQSRFKASAELIKLLSGQPLTVLHDPCELLILRDIDGNLVEYSDTVRTRKMRRNLQEINEALLAVAIGLQGRRIIKSGDPLSVGGANIGAAHNNLHRVFNRGTFRLGGRLYGGWWQNIPKELRQHITIDGHRTIELDYPRLHPTFLYTQAGKPFEGDPYEIAGWDRSLAKMAFNTLVNADTRLAAVRSIANEIGGEGARGAADRLVREIEAKHASIAHMFGTGAGLRLMRHDSDLTEGLLLDLISTPRVAVLPIHDSYIVPERHKGELMEAMVSAMDGTLKLVSRSAHFSREFEESDLQYGEKSGLAGVVGSSSVASVVVLFPDLPQRDLFGAHRIEIPASDLLDWRGGLAPVGVRHALRHEAKRLGLRQEDLAKSLGLSRPQLVNVLHGRFGASPDAAQRIRNFLVEGAKTVGGRSV